MPGKNSEIYHGYRGVGHLFGGCPIKHRCPDCEHGFQKFFAVESDTPNKGRFFKCCSHKCGFWDWYEKGEATGESGNAKVLLARLAAHTEVDDMCRMFESQVRLNNDEEPLIFVNVNMIVRCGKPPAERETNGKDTE